MAVKEQRSDHGAKPQRGDRPLPGLVWAFLFHPDGSSEELPADRPIAGHMDGWVWLHFDLPDGEAPQIPSSLSKMPPPAMELLATADERQQLQAEEGCIFGVFANLIGGRDQSDRGFSFVRFAMTEKLLVSNRGQALEALTATREALRGGRRIETAANLLVAIVEHVIDAVDGISDAMLDAVLSRAAQSGPPQ